MPYRVDTAMVNSLKNTAGAGFGNGMYMTRIRVTGQSAASALTITDNPGNIIFNGLSPTVGTDMEVVFNSPLPFSDFKVTAVPTAGIVYIYCL